jgi:hypothetical protein
MQVDMLGGFIFVINGRDARTSRRAPRDRTRCQKTAEARAGALPEVNSRQLAAVQAVAEYRSFIAASTARPWMISH